MTKILRGFSGLGLALVATWLVVEDALQGKPPTIKEAIYAIATVLAAKAEPGEDDIALSALFKRLGINDKSDPK